MCVLIGPEVIINNAFYARKNESKNSLAISELQQFNFILYDKMTKENDTGVRYKYVCFLADWKDVEEFCRTDEQFINSIDTVYCTKQIEEEAVQRVNSIYTPDIQMMIQNAREDFRRLRIE